MSIRRILFLSLGLTRVYSPGEERKGRTRTSDRLLEPDGSKICRRNILALSGVVVLAGFAGANPRELNVFGVMPSGVLGIPVLCMAVIFVHLYWYILRYHHLKEDGIIEKFPILEGESTRYLKISGNPETFVLVRKSADLFSNCAAFVLTLASWYFVVSWIVG